MTDVTHILNAIEQGDPEAVNVLLPLVYEELRVLAAQKLSREWPGQTLQATALVHEAYVRLVGSEDQEWKGAGISLPLPLKRCGEFLSKTRAENRVLDVEVVTRESIFMDWKWLQMGLRMSFLHWMKL